MFDGLHPIAITTPAGVRLDGAVQGHRDGTPLVLLIARDAWRSALPIFARLAPEIRAFALQLADPADDAEIAGHAIGALDALRLPRAIVAGLGPCGRIAQRVASLAPHRVSGLLVTGAPSPVEHPAAIAARISAFCGETARMAA